jgi:hypothetical protein
VNGFPGRVVADPFMGRGTPLIEANGGEGEDLLQYFKNVCGVVDIWG